MIAGFFKRLSAGAEQGLSVDDERLALTALLVRIARADEHYSGEEMDQIDKVLARRYALSPFEAAALRREGEAVEADAPDTVRFTRAIKDAVPHDERTRVIEALWRVVLADGVRDAEEDAVVRLAANLLGINDRDSALARQRVSAA
ncbi:TerB family tellurite resistance protein [uncultured Shimia sp.]|uniref:tellurite resistance TerB family protein n=1 Tax=uncultured Shimia sp. TaxID=573152 RepID=UPI0026347751|nr:TerB family tellurite resistance protein [uncultured Shimia sp.]